MSDDVLRAALWALDLTRLAEPSEPNGGYALAEVRGGVPAVHLTAASGLGDHEVSERLWRGARAWACWHRPEADLAAWLWVSTGREWAPPLRQDLHFAPDECYGWNAGTLPEHRGRGLFTILLQHAGWRMHQAGHRLMWGGIEDSNLASRRANMAAGFRPILRLLAVHEPPPTRLHVWPADYADERLVERARRMLGNSDWREGECLAAAGHRSQAR
jgi:GNAT superfamily N-acetyltransferase